MAENHSNPLYALCVLLNCYINSSGLLHPQISWTVTQWVTLMIQGFSKPKCFVWLFLTALVPEEIFALALSPLPLEFLLHCFLSTLFLYQLIKLNYLKKKIKSQENMNTLPSYMSFSPENKNMVHTYLTLDGIAVF